MVWSGSRPACLPLPSFVSQCFSFVSQASFHLSPTSFHLSPSSFHLSPRLGACGRVPGWLVSHFLSFVSHFFSFVSQFFSFVSQAEWLWWGFRLACLPLPCICLPLLFICLPLLFTCLSPRLGACGGVFGWLVSHFLSIVSHFFSFVSLGACGRVPAGSRLACLPLPFASFHLYPSSFHLSPRLGCLWWGFRLACSHFLSIVSNFFSFVSLGACGRVPGWLVSGLVLHCYKFFTPISNLMHA